MHLKPELRLPLPLDKISALAKSAFHCSISASKGEYYYYTTNFQKFSLTVGFNYDYHIFHSQKYIIFAKLALPNWHCQIGIAKLC